MEQHLSDIQERADVPAQNGLAAFPALRRRLLEKNECAAPSAAVLEPEFIAILTQAFDEACAFLSGRGRLSVAKREEIASVIIAYGRYGDLDAHRLALKAIVKVA